MTTNDAVRTALSWLATYGVHSTLFLGGAWLLCALRPPRIDRNRERLWKLALVGGLLSATLQVASGARPLLGRLDWPAAELARRAAPAPSGAPRAELPSLASGPIVPAVKGLRPNERELEEERAPAAIELADVRAPTLPVGPASPSEERVSRPHPAAEPSRAAPPSAGRTSQTWLARLAPLSASERWPGLVLGTWIATGLLGVVGLCFSWAGLRRRMLGRRLLEHGPLVELLERVRARAGVARRVRLSVSPRIVAPFSTGILRPEVCVPSAVVTALSSAQQEALLAHELAHIVRRDPAWFGLGFVIEKVFFFQPLNVLARRRLAELAEVACDDWAVRWTGARVALASCLAEVAGWVVGERPRLAMSPGLAGQRSRLARRVQRLLDDRRSPANDPPARWWPPLAAAALALAALAVPGVSAGNRPNVAARAPAEPAPSAAAEPAVTRDAVPATDPVPELTLSPREQLSVERGVLEAELVLLESDLRALHEELEARALRQRFADALQRIDARMDELRVQEARASELLALLATTNTPAHGREPGAEARPPTPDSGDSR
jgi:beta-lactamase regulating signal transducer with metallopeptidase domain